MYLFVLLLHSILTMQYSKKLFGLLFIGCQLLSSADSFAQNSQFNNGYGNDYYTVDVPKLSPTYTDSEYQAKIASLEATIPLRYNETVKAYIHAYTKRKRELSERILGLTQIYFPIFDKVLARYDLPNELKYLAIPESALKGHAVSRAGATGLWQIMKGTAREQYLTVDEYIDERLDPEKATDAAVRYLKRLHDKYDDWLLAIAAYNCGPGKVNQAIRRSGGKRNYWQIRRYLPRETRDYVPAYIACIYWTEYYFDHYLDPISPPHLNELQGSDTVKVKGPLSLHAVSAATGVDLETLKRLNPSLKKAYIPTGRFPYTLRLPITEIFAFKQQQNGTYAYADQAANNQQAAMGMIATNASYTNQTRVLYGSYKNTAPASPKAIAPTELIDSSISTQEQIAAAPSKSIIKYVVKKNDNLGYIASWYNCTVNDLKRWNDLSSRLNIGDEIKVFIPTNLLAETEKINELGFEAKQNLVQQRLNRIAAIEKAEQEDAERTAKEQEAEEKRLSGISEYKVRKGDSLWLIARRFAGSSIQTLLDLNGISKHTKLKPGMVLKVKM